MTFLGGSGMTNVENRVTESAKNRTNSPGPDQMSAVSVKCPRNVDLGSCVPTRRKFLTPKFLRFWRVLLRIELHMPATHVHLIMELAYSVERYDFCTK